MRSSLLGLFLACLAACDSPRAAPPFAVVKSWRFPDPLAAIDISRDGRAVVFGSATGESSMWSAPWNLSVPFERMDGELIGASFTAEGYVLLMRAPGVVELRSSSGAAIQELRMPLERPSRYARASRSGRFVAFDTRVYRLDTQRLAADGGEPEGLVAIDFADDRVVLFADDRAGTVRVLGLDATASRRFEIATGKLTSADTSGDGHRVAASTIAGIAIWHGDEPQPLCEHAWSSAVSAIRFSRSGRWVALTTATKLHILDVDACEHRSAVRLDAPATALDIDGDGVAVGDRAGNVYLWDNFNAQLLGRMRAFEAPVSHLRIHGATRTVLAAANGGGGSTAKLLRAAETP